MNNFIVHYEYNWQVLVQHTTEYQLLPVDVMYDQVSTHQVKTCKFRVCTRTIQSDYSTFSL